VPAHTELPAELQASLRAYRRLLEHEFATRLRSVRLFGSQARGDADVDSDADVSVVVDGLTDDERARAIDLAFEAWRAAGATGPLISALPWSVAERDRRIALEKRVALDIEREGVAI
jgi:predicted nucleotidyltransferase